MRWSAPMAVFTWSTSAPTDSARLAISLMKLMRRASMALAAYFVSSALGGSMRNHLPPLRSRKDW